MLDTAIARPLPRLLFALAVSVLGGSGAWAAPDTKAATEVLLSARKSSALLVQQHNAALNREKVNCGAARAADDALEQDADDSPAHLAQLATRARVEQRNCSLARQDVATASRQLEAVRAVMRQSASQLALCAAGTESECKVSALQVQLDQAQRAAGLPGLLSTATAYRPPGDDDLKQLYADSIAAQAAVDTLRGKVKKVYGISDATKSGALAVDWSKLPKETQDAKEFADAKSLLGTSQAAVDQQPGLALEALKQAQHAVTRFVDETAELKKCDPKDEECSKTHYAAADKARSEARKQSAEAKATLEKWTEAGYVFAALDPKSMPDPGALDLTGLQQRVAFRKFLDSNPDAKSYFGDDAIGLSAGSSKGSTTLRYTLGNPSVLGRYRVTLIGTTPTDPNGATSLYNNADKLANKTRLDLAVQSTRPAFKGGDFLGVSDVALGAGYTHTKYSYLVADATPGKLNAVDRYHDDYSFGGRWAFMNPRGGNTDLLILSLDRQRAFEFDPASPQIRCPVDPAVGALTQVVCTNKLLGPPGKKYNTLWGFSYRAHFAAADVAVKVHYSYTDRKTDYEVPVYFVRNRDDDKNGFPFSGGISVGRQAGDPDVKWTIFVSTPLSFGRPDRSE